LARNTRKICVLQIDERFLHAVRFEDGDAGLRIIAESSQPGDWKREDGSLAVALKAFVEKLALGEDDVYSVLSRQEIASRFLMFPTHDDAELASMVRFSAAEYVPFPEHELHIGQCFVSKESGGEGRALAVYAQKDIIKKHLELLRSAGIVSAGIYLSTSCLANAVEAAGLQEERFALMNLAAGGVEVLVFEKGRLFFGRAVAVYHDWRPADILPDTYLRELAMELRGSLSAYRRETDHGEPAETVYLCSDIFDPSSLCEGLGTETAKDCRPVRFAGGVVGGVEMLQNPMQLTALGAARLATGDDSYCINLLPDDLQRVREIRGLQRSLLRIGAFAAIFLLALLGLFAQAVYQRMSYISVLEEQAASIAPMAEGVAAKQHQLDIIKQQVEGSGNVLGAMWAVSQAVPPQNMTITQFDYKSGDTIDIFGQALSVDVVALFASQLRNMAEGQLDYFKNAKSLYESRSALFNQEVYNFQITVPMKVDDAL